MSSTHHPACRRGLICRRPHGRQHAGIILLIVLSSLTFFSILLATYLVYTRASAESAFAIARRNTSKPDTKALLNEALMTFVRGTNNPTSSFYGEDLLSDYYGRKDAINGQSHHVDSFPAGPQFVQQFVQLPVSLDGTTRPAVAAVDDVYANRIITFTTGPLRNRTFRILRSRYVATTGAVPAHDQIFFDLPRDVFGVGVTPTIIEIRQLFYADDTDLTTGGFSFHLNGSPRNARGIGYTGVNVDATTLDGVMTTADGRTYAAAFGQPTDPDLVFNATTNRAIGFDLPPALQPNHLGNQVDKSQIPGDFDEDYDAPDFNNWFLAHRRADNSVVPSFHRPAVLNYLLNQNTDWSAASNVDYRDLMVSLQRGTFRPIPIAAGQFAVGASARNNRFNGGNSSFALKTALLLQMGNEQSLNQLADALITGPFDVDNDGSGTNDSIWMDIDLPTFTAPDGRLIKPMIAPMIEDLSGRLNVNAVSNGQIDPAIAGLQNSSAAWAKSVGEYSSQYASGGTATNEFMFRGLGWGPSDMSIPITVGGGTVTAAQRTGISTALADLFRLRLRYGSQSLQTLEKAGVIVRDMPDAIQFGARPPEHFAAGGVGYSVDPFGRGGTAMGRSGQIISGGTGSIISPDDPLTTPEIDPINEAYNSPYELDPSGRGAGDNLYTYAEFEPIWRQYEFNTEIFPLRLKNFFATVFAQNNAYAEQLATSLTPHSKSDESLPPLDEVRSPLLTLVDLLNDLSGGTLTQDELERLLPAEIRLGHRMDLNRRIGNGLDDNGNLVIDDPAETRRSDFDGTDNDGDSTTDETDGSEQTIGESTAFFVRSGGVTLPTDFTNVHPKYTFDSPASLNFSGTPTATGFDGRYLLARDLYVLAMMLTRDIDSPTTAAPAFPLPAMPVLTPNEQQLYRANRLAQWAVNAVDYFDNDSIMTAFEYDPDPFTKGVAATTGTGTGTPQVRRGWDVDGNLATAETISVAFSPAGVATHMPRPVVWGVESLELVFSESYATHDLRVHDGDRDSGPDTDKSDTTNPDPNTDQVRIPEGSLFLELYCPREVIDPTATAADQNQITKPALPAELYDINATTGVASLDLSRQAGGVTTGAPVWRIAFTDRHDNTTTDVNFDADRSDDDPMQQRDILPDTYSFDIFHPNLLDETDTADVDIGYDRFIFFTDIANTDTNPDAAYTTLDTLLTNIGLSGTTDQSQRTEPQQVFYVPSLGGGTINTIRNLGVGQYCTLAPRINTIFGSQTFGGVAPGIPSQQRLQVDNTQGLLHANLTGVRQTPLMGPTANYTPALALVVAAPRPLGWAIPGAGSNLQNNVVGVSVSEPLPRGGSYYLQPSQLYNGTEDQDGAGGQDYTLVDGYIDYSDPATEARDEPFDVAIGRIPTDGIESQTGTFSNYCTAFLQRLADPTQQWNATTNPYRTVDMIPIDLTVFSGEERDDKVAPGNLYATRTRQRDGFVRPAGDPVGGTSTSQNALFSYETNTDSTGTALDGANPNFFAFPIGGGGPGTQSLQNSLSVLNHVTATYNLGYVGFSDSIGSLTNVPRINGNDRNLPQTPFAMHPWLNRPAASAAELLMVPASSSARLFEEFTAIDPAGVDPRIYPTDDAGGRTDIAVFRGGFRHLLNFFFSSKTSAETPELARLFSFVHTRPRFNGEMVPLSPVRVGPGAASPAFLRDLFSPPYNYLYDNQRVGAVNLNTIASFQTWVGLMQGHLNAAEYVDPGGLTPTQLAYNNFIINRRGYPVTSGAPVVRTTGAGPYNYLPNHLSPDYPTEFAGGYRDAMNANFALPIRNTGVRDLRRRGVHSTVLRGGGTLQQNDPIVVGPPTETSLFVRAATEEPLATVQPHMDRFRNPWLRYQTLMRMPNLASDNSQVFLVRLTLGFFEVDSDRLQLGSEYNAEFGTQKRYRATFVVDRSIPVGFVPGTDLNSRDVVVFESYDE